MRIHQPKTLHDLRKALRIERSVIIIPREEKDLIQHLAKAWKLHPLTVEDIIQPAQVKIESFKGYTYIGLALPQHAKHGWTFRDADVIIRDTQIAIITPHPLEEERPLLERRQTSRADGWMLFYHVLDTLLESYTAFTEDMMKAYQRLEASIFKGTVRLDQLLTLKNQLLLAKRYATTLRDKIGTLTHTLPKRYQPYYRDLHDHLIHTVDSLDYALQLAGSSIDIYLSEINNRTNDVMRVLTVVSTIFLPLTLIAGIYGMNFKHMPELSWQYGYYATLTIMLLIALSLLFYFKRKGWV